MRSLARILLPIFLFLTGMDDVCCAPLQLCYEDVAQKPWTMPDGSGLNIVLLKRVEKLLGESFVFTAKPWKRCIEETRIGVMDGYFAATNTDERHQFSAFPTLPNGMPDKSAMLNETAAIVYLKKDGKGVWDGKKLESPALPILVQRGYYVATMLRRQGLQVEESIKSSEDGLRALLQNRADVAVLQGEEARYLVGHDSKFKDAVIASSIPYTTTSQYLAISRKVYDDNPKRIEAIWNAIRTVRESAEYRALLDAKVMH